MKLLRVTDGYVELAAIQEQGMVELYVTSPGSGSDIPVVRAHLPEKLAGKLAFWLIRYWIMERLMGLRGWLERRKARKQLLEDSMAEDLHRD